jgi:ornithine carbamoyltransferase
MLFMPYPIGSALGIEPSPPRDTATLLVAATLLQPGKHTGGSRLLQGRNIGMLCDGDGESESMTSFRRAATDLGAHVAQICLGLWDLRDEAELRRVVGVLGRLYDTVVCQGASPPRLNEACKAAALPLYGNIARASQHLAKLAEGLEGDASPDTKRQAVMQAALIRSFN